MICAASIHKTCNFAYYTFILDICYKKTYIIVMHTQLFARRFRRSIHTLVAIVLGAASSVHFIACEKEFQRPHFTAQEEQ